MKTLIFQNQQGIDVRYKTDIVGNQKGNFTVLEIIGLDTIEEEKLFLFQQISYNYFNFIKFSVDHNLTFIVEEPSGVKIENQEILGGNLEYSDAYDLSYK